MCRLNVIIKNPLIVLNDDRGIAGAKEVRAGAVEGGQRAVERFDVPDNDLSLISPL